MSIYTKSGFSKNFGCCSYWKTCEMGKFECQYADKDPETMQSCSAWKRNNLPTTTSRRIVTQEQPTLTPLTLERLEESVIKPIVVEEQLALF